MTQLQLAPALDHLDVTGFAAAYTTEVIRCLDALLPNIPAVLPRLIEASSGDRGTVYFLGNGGSSAIARSLALAATDLIGSGRTGTRWIGAWDPHRLAAEATTHGFDAAAARLLARDSADHRDLVVLISGSGNSRNLVDTAHHCLQRGIPILTLTGRPGGALAPLDPSGLRVDSTDQQVIEDVTHAAGLALLQMLATTATDTATDDVTTARVLRHSRCQMAHALTVHQTWLQSLFAATFATAAAGGRIAVLAPQGGGVGLSAEHTAHNLRWDLRHDNHHARLRVLDGTSLCDDTGMSNDTGTSGLATARLLDDITAGDLVLLFADDPEHPALRPVLAAAHGVAGSSGVAVFGCYQTGAPPSPPGSAWHTGVRGPLAPLTAQTVGHLLLRSVRAATLIQDRDQGDRRPLDRVWDPVAPQQDRCTQ